MKKLLTSALLVSISLTGCAANKIWVSDTVGSQAQVNADLAACDNYARTGIDTSTKAPDKPKVYDTDCRGGFGSVSCTTTEKDPPNSAANAIGYALGKGLANGIIMGKKKKNCMKNKGYQLVNKNQVWKKTVRENPSLREVPEGMKEGSAEHAMWLNGIKMDTKDAVSPKKAQPAPLASMASITDKFWDDNPEYSALAEKYGFKHPEKASIAQKMNPEYLSVAEKAVFSKGHDSMVFCCREELQGLLLKMIQPKHRTAIGQTILEHTSSAEELMVELLKDKHAIGEYVMLAGEQRVKFFASYLERLNGN